jgi:hypothetical protein
MAFGSAGSAELPDLADGEHIRVADFAFSFDLGAAGHFCKAPVNLCRP